LPYNLALAWKTVAENSVIENAYGPTEVTVWSSMYRFDNHTSHEVINGLAPIGKILPGLTYRICDEQLNPVKKGCQGELILYGRQVANGYWKNTAKTASAFIKMNDTKFPGNWYKTGDIVVENEKNNIIYINRKDNQVQINGFRVELGEIEFRIREYIQKESVVVLPYENENNTLTLIAFIEKIGDEIQNLKNHLTLTLPSYMIPKKFYSVDSMPLNNSGKIDRKRLLEIHAEN
ncbi:MAG TPA: AMP-binding protein, partial [Bacteroidia bacterium]|nr:AMP-binding protein [Bacteroidia bacterium]